jgi:two-component system, cell cycle sensor histidine kinase and response regulator CckA
VGHLMVRGSGSDALPYDKKLRVLIAEDNPDDLELTLRALKRSGLELDVETVSTRSDFVKRLEDTPVDLVLSDYRMPGWTGIDALTEIVKSGRDIPLILLTGTLGDGKAVECIKLGITDYVLKHQLARLPMAIIRAQEERLLRVAERKAVDALRVSEAHFRTLVENAPEAIVVLDVHKGVFVDCNHNALKLFRLSREALMRCGPGELSPPFQPDGRHSAVASRDWVDRTINDAKPSFEWTHRNADDEEIACEVHLVRLPSEPDEPMIRASILDITERKRSEETVREIEVRYRELVNNASYGIYWVTFDDMLLDANPAMIQMLGYDDVHDVLRLSKSAPLFCDPSVFAEIAGMARVQTRVEAVAEWKRKGDKRITVRLVGRRTKDLIRKVDCIEFFVEDISERLALEKQLAQVQKFEAIGQLAGGIAHDFNNMIGAIMGWAELGIEETDPESRLHRHFNKVRQQAERAAALTQQLLAFARKQILEPRNIDLNQCITETLSLLEKVIGSNIEIRVDLHLSPPAARADPTQIAQVVMNLCINARDAMPNGGKLEIESSSESIDEAFRAAHSLGHAGKFALIRVTDTGTGMDQGTLDRIFEPFFTTKETGKGTGLGLATIYGIVRQHGGFVEVASEVGVGTTFRVYLPLTATESVAEAAPKSANTIRGGLETILLAEDHDGLREIARETLASLGYTVIVACDGEEAIGEFKKAPGKIDLLIFDVMLPKKSGPEAFTEILNLRHDVPVLFATGYSADTALLQRPEMHGAALLQKPYVPRDLARRVREMLDQHVSKLNPV